MAEQLISERIFQEDGAEFKVTRTLVSASVGGESRDPVREVPVLCNIYSILRAALITVNNFGPEESRMELEEVKNSCLAELVFLMEGREEMEKILNG